MSKEKSHGDSASSASTEISSRNRALAFLKQQASRVEEWGISHQTGEHPDPAVWIAYEAFAYLGSRNQITPEQQEIILKCWQREARQESDHFEQHREYLGDQPASFWDDHRFGPSEDRDDAAVTAAVLRTKSNCQINEETLDERVDRWADDERAFRRLREVPEPSLRRSLFHLCRSDLALQLAGHRYANSVVELCNYQPPNGILPCAGPPSSKGERVDVTWAAMMLVIGQRLQSGLFQRELEEQALEAVKSGRQRKGYWLALTKDSARPSVFTTAAAIHALALTQSMGSQEAADCVVKWLWTQQNRDDGSWKEHGFHDCYLTVLVLDAIDLAKGRSPLTFVPNYIGKRSSRGKKRRRPAVIENGSQVPFVPNEFQSAILRALNGRALTKQALADVVCSREGTRLYRKGGIKELMAVGKVCHKHRLGYYRPDAPPPSP